MAAQVGSATTTRSRHGAERLQSPSAVLLVADANVERNTDVTQGAGHGWVKQVGHAAVARSGQVHLANSLLNVVRNCGAVRGVVDTDGINVEGCKQVVDEHRAVD